MLVTLKLVEKPKLLGHERPVLFLQQLLDEARLPQALCFCGPSGIGKRTLAEIFAARDLCQQKPAFNPQETSNSFLYCGACSPCLKLQSGNHPDVLRVEPEGANFKIDEVREATRQVRFNPLFSQRRWIIFDQAELLTEQAQNALLRTLEEPPRETHFILVSSSLAKLLQTIRSRCQVLRFSPLPKTAVKTILSRLDLPTEEHDALISLLQGRPGQVADLKNSGLIELRNELLAFLLNLVTRGSQPEQALAALAMAQSMAGHKGDRYIILEIIKTFLRDLALLLTHVNLENLVHPDFWRNRDLDMKQTLANLTPGPVLEAYQKVVQLEQDFKVNVNAELSFDRLFQDITGAICERSKQVIGKSSGTPGRNQASAAHGSRNSAGGFEPRA